MSVRVQSSLKSAMKGTVFVFFGMIASTALWLLTKLLIVWNTTVEQFGVYAFAVAVVNFVETCTSGGLQNGIPRFVSMSQGESAEYEFGQVVQSSVMLGSTLGITASLAVYLGADLMARHVFYDPGLTEPIRIMAAFIAFNAMANVMQSILRGYGDVQARVIFINFMQPFVFLLLLGAWSQFALPFNFVLYSYSGAFGVSCLGIYVYAWRKHGLNPIGIRSLKYAWTILSFSLPLFAGSLAGILMTWTDTLMLGRYGTTADVGIYNGAVPFVRMMLIPLTAAIFVYMPIAGEMYAQRQHKEMERSYQIVTKWIYSITFPLFFVLFFFPTMSLTYLFGPEFASAAPALAILAAGHLVYIMVGPNTTLLIITGHTYKIMRISAITAGTNIVLNYILIKQFGMGITGAAIATAISLAASGVLTAVEAYRLADIHPFTADFIKPTLISFGAGGAIYAVAKLAPFSLWLIPVYFLALIVMYAGGLVLSRSIQEEDVRLIEIFAKKAGLEVKGLTAFLRGSFQQ